jgi:homoaconitase/3-isopropylmalate dehydratase large subunit
VPESLKIIIRNKFRPGVTTKDLSLHVISHLGSDGGLYESIEWHGDTIRYLGLDQRAVLTNISSEMGAKNSYIPPDDKTFSYLDGRAKRQYDPIFPDPDARYAGIIEYDAGSIEPMVACPHAVDNVKKVSEVIGQRVDAAFIGTCTNGRFEDLAAAAQVLKGKKINSRTRMIIIPASSEIHKDAIRAGFIDIFIDAGAVVGNPGCGPCMGNHMGVLTAGEVAITTANRNFKGRMGSSESEIYLASPQTVAASAIKGSIIHPKYLY